MEGYSAKITASSRELTAKEKVMFKDKSNAIALDTACENGNVITFHPVGYVVVQIHNEKSERKDYENYILFDENGQKYATSSPSFWSTFRDIYDEMCEVDEPWELSCFKVDSKNYKGKQFLTCSIV